MKTVKLTDYTVELNDQLTYGMNEQIKAATVGAMRISADMRKKLEAGTEQGEIALNGEAMLAAKYKAAEVIITSIEDKEGTKVRYTNEWLANLSIADGEKLEDAINEIKDGNEGKK
jgi:hypothetical protein